MIIFLGSLIIIPLPFPPIIPSFFNPNLILFLVPSSKMRSSSTVPRPPHQQQQKQQPRPLPRQNGVAKSRDGSRSRSAASHPNGPTQRTPSVPPPMTTTTPKNKRYAHVKSKVGSMSDWTPPPSQVRIFHQPLRLSATPKVGSLQNAAHVPAGGNVKIENRKLNFRETAKPKVEAKSEVPIPKSDKKIPSQKLVWNVESKVGSLENAKHKPGGGQLKIFNEPIRVKAESKVGSLDNVGHVPGGGNVKISDYSRSISGASGGESVRSRRDTADSGRSSSSAGIGTQPEVANSIREEERVEERRDGKGEEVVTSREQQQNNVAEGEEAELISFGE